MPYFEIYQDGQGNFHWLFRASNGTILARSEEGFINKVNCEHSILLLKQQAAKAQSRDRMESIHQAQPIGES